MTVRIFVERTGLPPGGNTSIGELPNGNECLVPNVGDTVQLGGMSAPEVVKKRHFKYISSNTLERSEVLLEVRLEV